MFDRPRAVGHIRSDLPFHVGDGRRQQSDALLRPAQALSSSLLFLLNALETPLNFAQPSLYLLDRCANRLMKHGELCISSGGLLLRLLLRRVQSILAKAVVFQPRLLLTQGLVRKHPLARRRPERAQGLLVLTEGIFERPQTVDPLAQAQIDGRRVPLGGLA